MHPNLLSFAATAFVLALPLSASAARPVTESGTVIAANAGGFFSLGGAEPYSNLQSFSGIDVGYRLARVIADTDMLLLLHWSYGAIDKNMATREAVNITSGEKRRGECKDLKASSENGEPVPAQLGGEWRCRALTQDYSIMNIGGSVLFSIPVAYRQRIRVVPRLTGGMSLTEPEALRDRSLSIFGDRSWFILAGGGLGVEYATHVPHFSVGLGADFLVLLPEPIMTIAIYPTVRYTF